MTLALWALQPSKGEQRDPGAGLWILPVMPGSERSKLGRVEGKRSPTEWSERIASDQWHDNHDWTIHLSRPGDCCRRLGKWNSENDCWLQNASRQQQTNEKINNDTNARWISTFCNLYEFLRLSKLWVQIFHIYHMSFLIWLVTSIKGHHSVSIVYIIIVVAVAIIISLLLLLQFADKPRTE